MENREEKLREKLTGELGITTWRGLLPDTLNKSLFFVSSELDLIEIGIHVAMDHTAEVKKLLESDRLVRPGKEQMEHWDKEGSLFQFIIVEPFVFFQDYTEPVG